MESNTTNNPKVISQSLMILPVPLFPKRADAQGCLNSRAAVAKQCPVQRSSGDGCLEKWTEPPKRTCRSEQIKQNQR